MSHFISNRPLVNFKLISNDDAVLLLFVTTV